MSIRKRGERYQIRVAPFPNQTVDTKTDAQRVERELKRRKELGDLFIEKAATLGEAVERHLERKRQGGKRGPLSAAGLRFVAQNLKPWKPLYNHQLPALRRAIVEDHIRARAAVAPKAARNELQELKAVLRAEEARDQRVDKQVYTIELGPTKARVGRALSVAELEQLAAAFPERVRRIVLVCGSVGLRFNEAVNLDESMLDLARSQLTIPAWLNKSKRLKVIDLSRTEVQWLREQLMVRTPGTTLVFPNTVGGLYSRTGFVKVWDKACLACGYGRQVSYVSEKTGRARQRIVSDLNFHDLRHTATSLMCAAGMRPEVVAARRGDADGGALVLRRYRHLYAGEVAAATAVMDVLFGKGSNESREAQ